MFKTLLHLLYPDMCCGCGKDLLSHESLLCDFCEYDLPYFNLGFQDNPLLQVLGKYEKVSYATSFLNFRKHGIVQSIIHKLKYKNNKEVGVLLGTKAGEILYESLSKVDIIIPVPLHKQKFRQRGYNQTHCIAQGLSQSLSKPFVTDSLLKNRYTETQTHKSKEERQRNITGSFSVAQIEQLHGNNILLVDDVFTTGSTLSACIEVLSDYVKEIVVFTLAYAE